MYTASFSTPARALLGLSGDGGRFSGDCCLEHGYSSPLVWYYGSRLWTIEALVLRMGEGRTLLCVYVWMGGGEADGLQRCLHR